MIDAPSHLQRKDSRDGFWVNDVLVDPREYCNFHEKRVRATMEKLGRLGARCVVELGSHPWVMTAALVEDPRFEVCATVSAEEITRWPDEIPIRRSRVTLRTRQGREAQFTNYSVNLERTLLDLEEKPDTVLACEIVEHLVRAPHLLFLNVNRWLPVGGRLLVTTPNGSQISNPFRRRSPSAAFRCHAYERHSFLFTKDGLADLVELCGFEVRELSYWNVYPYRGLSRFIRPLGRVPWSYLQDKVQRTILLVAEKGRAVGELARLPKVYHPSNDWELISRRSATTEEADAGQVD